MAGEFEAKRDLCNELYVKQSVKINREEFFDYNGEPISHRLNLVRSFLPSYLSLFATRDQLERLDETLNSLMLRYYVEENQKKDNDN